MARTSTLEYAVEDYLVKRVKALGGICLKADQIPGQRFLDRICFLPRGAVLVVECKRPKGGVVAAHQRVIAERLTALGHKVRVARSKEDIDDLLEDYVAEKI